MREISEISLRSEQGFATERKRVEAVVETLAMLGSEGDSLAELAHDARNMVTALGLYCDLLEEPGVLATQFAHYGGELRLVASASRRLVEKLVSLDVRGNSLPRPTARGRFTSRPPASLPLTTEIAAREGSPDGAPLNQSPIATEPGAKTGNVAGVAARVGQANRWDLLPPTLISNLAQDLLASRNLLSALAGPSIALTVDAEGGALPVRLNAEDLTRVLVNLVKNAAEAMPGSGFIRIGLRTRTDQADIAAEKSDDGPIHPEELSLTIEDSGPGIPTKTLERVFEAGFTTRAARGAAIAGSWPSAHRGLGLSISRSIVEAAGGQICATNCTPGRGARIEIVLPVRGR